MDKLFLYDKNKINYYDLFKLLNNKDSINMLSEFEQSVISIFSQIVVDKVLDFDDFANQIYNYKGTIDVLSSGTSGPPKKISHDISNILKNIKISDKYNNSIWANTYSPGKMAFIQVLFQSILNKNSIINCFGYSTNEIINRIILEKVNYISATPTFYRLITNDDIVINNIIQTTSGGEILEDSLLLKIKKTFPNSKIRNVYASSEASSLFSSNSNIFEIPNKLNDLIKIENNELIINKKLLGNFNINNEWYHTGDLVKFISDNKFKFIGRENGVVKVAGYLINTNYVESVINEFPGVILSKVYSKKNSITSNIIFCDICLNNKSNLSDLKKYLKKKLNKYEIPVIFRLVNEIELTDSLKIKRQ
jgi:acyl-coenzyme A synthetase/AMP-(fatty) acid ligase